MKRNRRAFTLAEVLITVIIIGLLAALGTPQYLKAVERGRQAEAYQVLGELRSAAFRYYNEHTAWPTRINDTDFDAIGYNNGTLPNSPIMYLGMTFRYFMHNNIEADGDVAYAQRHDNNYGSNFGTGAAYEMNILINGEYSINGGP